MQVYIAMIVCLIFICISIISIRISINPLLILGVLWLLILILNSLGLYQLNATNKEIYSIISWGIIAFGIGYIVVSIFKKKYTFSLNRVNKNIRINTQRAYIPKYKLLCIMGIICIIFYLKSMPTILSLLINGEGLDTIRNMVQDPESIVNVRSNIENAIRILIIIPVSLALEVIVAIDFWFGKRQKKLLVITLIMILLRVLTEGGRTPIVNFLMYLIIGFIFINLKNKRYKLNYNKNKIKKRYIFLIIVLGAAILYYTTISRVTEEALKTTYYYFAMEPYMFDVWAQIANENKLIGYGMASLNGFIFPVLYVIKNFFGIPFPEYWASIYELILRTDSEWKVIASTGIRANAYVSMFWFFYLDGRVWGVIIGMFLYGMINANYFVNAIKYPNAKNVCIYSLIIQGLFFSFIRFPFSNLYYALAFLFIKFIAYKPIIQQVNAEEIQQIGGRE